MAEGLTERQQRWFASVRARLESDTGKSLEEWVAIARTCPETKPRARLAWMKAHHGLGQNRASYVLTEAFPSEAGWETPDVLRQALWSDVTSGKILAVVEALATPLPEVVTGQRKGYTAFSRKVQFAAIRPLKDGKAMLGLALEPHEHPLLEAPKNEPWSERLHARRPLNSPADADAELKALIEKAWERS
ncbi:DUF4287 domain-containing protein [Phenylobacterium deserti]|uniref:DUF4287 domain-containing protein n=1 Tax=Phenylobacterium deserti TaxID=1914756 RepID=A0A328AA19_9CAUL|nr:DUF4287 domain-containing protein [Phenylobacterium deserti]RAK51016.1 DUF4287 domain-containing protein [Phenylobacterium deserti]